MTGIRALAQNAGYWAYLALLVVLLASANQWGPHLLGLVNPSASEMTCTEWRTSGGHTRRLAVAEVSDELDLPSHLRASAAAAVDRSISAACATHDGDYHPVNADLRGSVRSAIEPGRP